MKTIGVIPARYNSSRMPGKPLADICGKPMLWWVYQQALKATTLNDIYVATDDERIKQVCVDYGFSFVMTSSSHPTAANRLYEVSNSVDADFYVAINGDEPLVDPKGIDAVIPDSWETDVEFGTNIIAKMSSPAEVMDPSNIKVAFDQDYNALYMSRTPIPYPFRSIQFEYYKHVGIIGYNKKMLQFYHSSKPGRFESIEGIDTLRFIDYGKKLKFIPLGNYQTLSVDTLKDLEKVRGIMKEKMERNEV